jgi:hypothetical protein
MEDTTMNRMLDYVRDIERWTCHAKYHLQPNVADKQAALDALSNAQAALRIAQDAIREG